MTSIQQQLSRYDYDLICKKWYESLPWKSHQIKRQKNIFLFLFLKYIHIYNIIYIHINICTYTLYINNRFLIMTSNSQRCAIVTSTLRHLNITNKFNIFELVQAPSLTFNRLFQFFGRNLSKKGIFSSKQEIYISANILIKFSIFSYHEIPKFFRCHEIYELKQKIFFKRFAHPLHSLKMIFKNSA